MAFLAVALVLALPALPALGWVRAKSDGEEPGHGMNKVAWIGSIAMACALATVALAALQFAPSLPLPAVDGWRLFALIGAYVGTVFYCISRVILAGLTSALHRWSCRLPPETDVPLGHRLILEVCILGGFVVALAIGQLLFYFAYKLGIPYWLFLPLAVGVLPLYQTFLVPWFQFVRTPRTTSRAVVDIAAWLDELRVQLGLPRFRIRVQEGRLANAFATGGLGAHLVVIGGGLLDRMSATELRAVLAHEIAHVAHGHVPRRILPLIVLGATLHVACLVLFVNPLFDRDEWPFLLAGIASAGASGGLFLAALPGFFMHKMEFQADRLAVEILGTGKPLMAALTKLADLNKHPLDAGSWSHPSTQARLDAIRALAPPTATSPA